MASMFFCLLILRKIELTSLLLLNVIIFLPENKSDVRTAYHSVILVHLALFLNGKYVFCLLILRKTELTPLLFIMHYALEA